MSAAILLFPNEAGGHRLEFDAVLLKHRLFALNELNHTGRYAMAERRGGFVSPVAG